MEKRTVCLKVEQTRKPLEVKKVKDMFLCGEGIARQMADLLLCRWSTAYCLLQELKMLPPSAPEAERGGLEERRRPPVFQF